LRVPVEILKPEGEGHGIKVAAKATLRIRALPEGAPP
jgi:hypothetical protein